MVISVKFQGKDMSNIYIFFGRLWQLCLHSCHMYLYCTLHVGWAHSFKEVSMPIYGTHCFI